MPTFDNPIYIKRSDESDDVIVFGKSPELRIKDSRNGISRFGGNWRMPNYTQAYLRSASVLISHGVQTNTLDDIGLPAFYLQRHATELLIKRLLSWLYELAELYSELGQDCQGVPSKQQRKRFKTSHKLTELLNDLSLVSIHFRFGNPPVELTELVREITYYEKSETWARYERSETKGGAVIHHVRDEVALPLVFLQHLLELTFSKTVYQFTDEQNYENKLYDQWLNAARAMGKAG